MAEVRQGRWTAAIEGDFVVFLIGARFQLAHPVRVGSGSTARGRLKRAVAGD